MITVVITNTNREFFKKIDSKIKFIDNTINTCSFRVNEQRFIKIRNGVREAGCNPFAVMYWQ